MENKKEMVVSAIENGTVIDHIPTESVYQVIRILGLEKYKDEVLIGNYLSSQKLEKKGIIKIKNKHFSVDIENYKVVKKFNAEIPDHIENFVRCANPKCITNAEVVPTRFDVVDKENLKLRCHYCEKFTTKETMKFSE